MQWNGPEGTLDRLEWLLVGCPAEGEWVQWKWGRKRHLEDIDTKGAAPAVVKLVHKRAGRR